MMILFALLGTALCIGTILFLERNEEGLKLITGKKDLLVIAGAFFIIEATLFSFTGYGREFVCHSLVFFYLITAAYIDNRTQQVYRVGSILFITFCVAIFLCKDMGWEIRFEKTISLLIFNMAVIAFGKMEFMGWGDVLTFAGVSYWLSVF
ncbi:MAG: prepilin peptidase, partial [Ruminococcus sp.]|nr:prepilin peptidase [Ruminococcus sp.]